MNRVETAIQEGRCVLVFGARALQDADTVGELRRRNSIPSIVLAGEPVPPALLPSVEALAPALSRDGGVIALVEADTTDAAGLNAIAIAVAEAKHKPRLVVVARAFNPFNLPAALRMLKFDHEKKKAKEFLFSLPVPAASVPAVVAAEEPKDKDKDKRKGGAPRAAFVGREEELPQLREMLAAGGPVVVSGPPGVGKRWLVEQALTGQPYTRIPDFLVGWGCETDALLARIALAGEKAGDGRLAEALRSPDSRPAPVALAALAADVLAALKDTVMVVDRLEHVLRRDGTFHRESRFELLLRALLLGRARVVFLSSVRPRFYREGEGAELRVLPLAGLKGRELHAIFDAYRVEDFARDNFGDIHERIHGHPFAARMFAVAVRDPEHRDELLANKKFMRLDAVEDLEPVKRRVQKQLESLSDAERAALTQIAHFRLPYTAADAKFIEIDRDVRLSLQARGLLDQLPETGGERQWHVHPLVHAQLPHRETSDYALLEALGDHYVRRAEAAEGLQKLVLAQEGNRLLFEAHRIRNRHRMPYPDNDPALESIRGMVRSKKPRFDLAEQRLAETLKMDPANTELHLLRAELGVATKAAPELVQEVFEGAQTKAPTPEAFHLEANWHQSRSGGRGRAAAALERAIVVFPENARLRRRLAGILVDQNKFDEAVATLKVAMDLEPMMPDTYGLLGEIHMRQGAAGYEAAEAALTEARRLDPESPLHMGRLGALIIERGELDDARAATAQELLTSAITADGKSYAALLYLGRMLIDREGDLDQASWALKKATKLDDRAAMPLVELARVAIRKGDLVEAGQLLDRAVRNEPSCHSAFYVRGELAWAMQNPFLALSEFQRAVERSQKDSKARGRYEEAIGRMRVLIESGAFAHMQKAAEEAAAVEAAQAAASAAGMRREPGKTTQRRRRGRGGERAAEGAPGDGVSADGTAVDGASVDGSEAAETAGAEAADLGNEVVEADGGERADDNGFARDGGDDASAPIDDAQLSEAAAAALEPGAE